MFIFFSPVRDSIDMFFNLVLEFDSHATLYDISDIFLDRWGPTVGFRFGVLAIVVQAGLGLTTRLHIVRRSLRR